MKIERTLPAQLRFQFERSVSRDVPVRVRHSGKPKEGFQLTVTPATVAIVGPESRVNRIEAADTDMIDLSNVSADAEFHVNAFIGDTHVRFKQPPRVIVKYFAERPNG
jgi:YbbR domain-containing protein